LGHLLIGIPATHGLPATRGFPLFEVLVGVARDRHRSVEAVKVLNSDHGATGCVAVGLHANASNAVAHGAFGAVDVGGYVGHADVAGKLFGSRHGGIVCASLGYGTRERDQQEHPSYLECILCVATMTGRCSKEPATIRKDQTAGERHTSGGRAVDAGDQLPQVEEVTAGALVSLTSARGV